jgi:hypothetical protein
VEESEEDVMAVGRLGILVLVGALSGCVSDGTDGEGLPEWVVSRSTTFGAEEGDGALSSVWGVAVSEAGHVFLSEPQFGRVVEFNPDGAFSHVVGSRGAGPGEFQAPGALSWRGDSLAVTDFQRGIHLFSPDGAFARLISFNINDGSSPFGVRPIFPLADGSVAALAPPGSSEITGGAVTHETWLKASRDGAITDSLAVLSQEGRLFSVRYQEAGRSGPHPLSWAPLLAAPPTGTSLIIVDRPPASDGGAATYHVLRVALDGDTLSAATLQYQPTPLSVQQIDSIALAMAQGWAESMNAPVPAVAAAITDQIQWPAYQPPVTVVIAGSDGSIWLRREVVGASSARWEVLDEDLSPMGWVALPLELELKVVARDRVYGVELDDFDVPRVVRFNVGEQR